MALDVNRVAAAPLTPFTGQGWRHLGPRHDPLSGDGARIHGGRFNPPGSFPVLYLCQSRSCAVAELGRFGARQAIGVEGLLPRKLYRYDVALDQILDLTSSEVRAQVGSQLGRPHRAGLDRLPGTRRHSAFPRCAGHQLTVGNRGR